MTRDRPSPRSAAYHRLSIAAKQRGWLAAAREQPVRCAACSTQLYPADMADHLTERCLGGREQRDAALVLRHGRRGVL